MRVTRGKLIALGATSAVLVGGYLSIAPVVRSRVAAEAERRRLEIDVGSVRVGWFSVRLLDVHVRPRGVPQVDAALAEVRVDLTASLSVRDVRVNGGHVELTGSPEELVDALRAWRGDASGGAGAAKSPPIRAEGLSVRWATPGRELSLVEATGAGFSRDEEGVRLVAELARARFRDGTAAAGGASVELDTTSKLKSARAESLTIAWELASSPVDTPPAPVIAAPPPLPPTTEKRGAKRAPPTPPAIPPDAHGQLVHLPDLHALRERAGAVAKLFAGRLPDGTDVAIDALSIKLTKDGASITTGPGPFSVARRADRVELRYATEASSGGTPLAVRADLPIDAGSVNLSLEGGPVSLALLGFKDGTAGITDVDRGTIAGKGRVVLSPEADALTFDGGIRLRNVGFHKPKIARDVVHGLDLGVSARGMFDDKGELRIDDFDATMGALHLTAGGALLQAPDHVGLSVRVDIPAASCQSLFESVPTALLPTLVGTKFSGTFAATGRMSFDSRKLDDLFLDYDIVNQCKFVEVPPALARERFQKPFQHRIYLPDGTVTEETTGPKTPRWVSFGAVSPYVLVAVQTTEDGGFFRHKGFSRPAIKSSLIANLKARKFERGASTITMQLAKNLFLVREKTLSRKFEEVILTDYLEQVFSKQELMELYLNVIEFGPKTYGIGAAAYYYFGRSASQLNLGESLFLSSLLPAPLKLSGLKSGGQLGDGWQRSIEHLMTIAKKSGLISEEELEEGKAQPVSFQNTGPRPPARRYVERHPEPAPTDGSDGDWQPTN